MLARFTYHESLPQVIAGELKPVQKIARPDMFPVTPGTTWSSHMNLFALEPG